MKSFFMKTKNPASLKVFVSLAIVLLFSVAGKSQVTTMNDYALFGGSLACPTGPNQTPPISPGCAVFIGAGSTVNGNVGSYHLVKTNGGVTINGNVYSGGLVNFANSVKAGRITAADGDGIGGDVIKTGCSATILGDLDANGDINITNTANCSSVAGKVSHFLTQTYSGPPPSGGEFFTGPNLPVLLSCRRS